MTNASLAQDDNTVLTNMT